MEATIPFSTQIVAPSFRTESVRLFNLYHELTQTPLTPSPTISRIFRDITAITMGNIHPASAQTIVSEIQPILPHFRQLQSLAEFELERAFARDIAQSSTPHDTLAQFPYYQGYEALIREEYHILSAALRTPLTECTFIGSGPLPLTAILLAQQYGVRVTCIEKDLQALTLSRHVVEKLNLAHLITMVESDILHYQERLPGQAIFLAALVGESTREKQILLEHLARTTGPGQFLCARTVENLGLVHYQPVSSHDLSDFTVVACATPPQPALNISLIGVKNAI